MSERYSFITTSIRPCTCGFIPSNIRRVVGEGHDTLFWFDHWVGESLLRFKFPRLFDLALNKECKVEEMEREGWGEGG